MSPYNQNICKWSALLHDICKRGMPLFQGADHIHAFASGAALLRIFRHFGIFKIEGENQEQEFDRLMDLIAQSV